MTKIEDKILWYSFVSGDKTAFSTIFKLYYSELHNYGLKISKNKPITEDCLQDFFIYLFEKRKTIENVNSIKVYLMISFKRALLKKIKKEKVFTDYNILSLPISSFEFSPEDIIVKKEFTSIKANLLAEMLNKLSTREREALYLKYYSDLNISEIASVMNISYQSTLNTIQKSFKRLRKSAENQSIKYILKNN